MIDSQETGEPKTSKSPLREWLDSIADGNECELMTMDGYDDCILGIAQQCAGEPVVLYDRDLVIQQLMRDDGMTEEEAEEFHEFNQAGAYVGKGTPMFLIRPPQWIDEAAPDSTLEQLDD